MALAKSTPFLARTLSVARWATVPRGAPPRRRPTPHTPPLQRTPGLAAHCDGDETLCLVCHRRRSPPLPRMLTRARSWVRILSGSAAQLLPSLLSPPAGKRRWVSPLVARPSLVAKTRSAELGSSVTVAVRRRPTSSVGDGCEAAKGPINRLVWIYDCLDAPFRSA